MLQETGMHKFFYPEHSLMVEDLLSVTKHSHSQDSLIIIIVITHFSLLHSNTFVNLFIINTHLRSLSNPCVCAVNIGLNINITLTLYYS